MGGSVMGGSIMGGSIMGRSSSGGLIADRSVRATLCQEVIHEISETREEGGQPSQKYHDH
jgi:hypothetical protein